MGIANPFIFQYEDCSDSESEPTKADIFMNTLSSTDVSTGKYDEYIASTLNIKYYVENDILYYSYGGSSQTLYITKEDMAYKFMDVDDTTQAYMGKSSAYEQTIIKITYSDSTYTTPTTITHIDMFTIASIDNTLKWTK